MNSLQYLVTVHVPDGVAPSDIMEVLRKVHSGVEYPVYVSNFSLDDARSRMRADYYHDVRGVVEDIISEIKSECITNSESLSTWLRETIDRHGRVIYTNRAVEGLLASDNDSVGFDDGLIDPSDWKDGINWSSLMYCAMERDVLDMLSAHGVDPDDPCAITDDETVGTNS